MMNNVDIQMINPNEGEEVISTPSPQEDAISEKFQPFGVGEDVGIVESEDNTGTTSPTLNMPEKESEPITFGAVQAALVKNTIVGSAVNSLMDYGMNLFEDEDEEFISTVGDKYKDLISQGLTEDRAQWIIDNSKNQDAYYYNIFEQERQQQNSEALASTGGAGTIMSVGFEVLDGIATVGGLAKVAGGLTFKLIEGGSKVVQSLGFSEKASTFLTKVVGGAGVETALEVPKHLISDNDRSELDYAFCIVGGGIAGGLTKTLSTDMAPPMVKHINEALEHKASLVGLPKEEADIISESFERTKVEQVLERGQLDYNQRFEKSPSPTMRALTQGENPIFTNPRFKTVGRRSAEEKNRHYRDTLNEALNNEFDPILKTFGEVFGVKTNKTSFGTRNKFFDYAGAVIHNLVDETNLPKEVLALHDSIRAANAKVANFAYDLNVQHQHPLFIDGIDGTAAAVARNDDYLPIQYDVTHIMSDIHAGNIQASDYVNLLIEGFKGTLRNAGVTDDLIKAQEEELTKRAALWYKKQEARHAMIEVEHYLDKGDVIDEYENLVADLVARFGMDETTAKASGNAAISQSMKDGGAISGRSKRRSGIDLSASIIGASGKKISLGSYVNSSLDLLWRNYGQKMGGDLSLRGLGLNSRADIKGLRQTIKQELELAYSSSPKAVNQELAYFDDTMKQFLGDPLVKDPDGLANKVVETLTSGARTSYLGMTWVPMMVEATATAFETGVRNMMSSTHFKDFIHTYRSNKADAVSEATMEARLHFGLGGGHIDSNHRFKYGADNYLESPAQKQAMKYYGEDKLARAADVVLRATKRAEEVIMNIGGSKTGQAFIENTMTTGVGATFYKYAKKGKIPDDIAKEFGWTPQVAEKIRKEILKHVNVVEQGDNVYHYEKWDRAIALEHSLGVKQYASIMIQTQNISDTLSIGFRGEVMKNTMSGKMLTSLLSYATTAHSKQFGRSLINRDKQQLYRNLAYTAGSVLATWTAAQLKYQNDPAKMYDKMQPIQFAKDVLKTHPVAGLISLGTSAAETLVGLDVDKDAEAYTKGLSLSPAMKVAKAAWQSGKIISGLADEDEYVSKKMFRQWLGVLAPNTVCANYVYDWVADKATVKEEYLHNK